MALLFVCCVLLSPATRPVGDKFWHCRPQTSFTGFKLTETRIENRLDSRGPLARLRHRGSNLLTELQNDRRQKVLARISVEHPGLWRWTGQAKSARGRRYPQIVHTPNVGEKQVVSARHAIFYLANGWVHDAVQQYRVRDGDPMNVHPDNLVPVPPLLVKRRNNHFWDTDRLRNYYG